MICKDCGEPFEDGEAVIGVVEGAYEHNENTDGAEGVDTSIINYYHRSCWYDIRFQPPTREHVT